MSDMCQRCGLVPREITHVCPPVTTSGPLYIGGTAPTPMRTSLPSEVWARIVFAAKESPDARLAQMIEQAVMEARNA